MLRRKRWRDLWGRPGQSLALALVFGLGVAAFVGVRSAYVGLDPTTAALYDRLALPDLVARVAFAPRGAVTEIAALPGVAAVEGRIALDTTAEGHPGVTVRVVSLPAPRQPKLGRVEVVRGRYLTGAADELLVAEGAAGFHDLQPGATLRLQDAAGQSAAFEVAGIVRQPEHLSMIPPGGYMGMPKGYVVVFVPEASAARLLGRSGGVTELALSLEPGAAAAGVRGQVRERLARYRVEVVSGAALPSVRNVRSHVEMLAGAGLVFPLLFLTAGALGGFVLLSRLVRQERGLIGLLRASGYTRAAVALHYLGYTVLLAGIGGALAAPAGLPIARLVRGIFASDLGTPIGADLWQIDVTLLGLAAAVVSGAVAGAAPAYAAARLPPAEAMRPEPPDGAVFAWLRLPTRTTIGLRMVLRNTLRRPLRTLLTALGVSLAVMLGLAPALVLRETDQIVRRVDAVRRYDLRAVPRLPQGEEWLSVIRAQPGVTRVEGVLELPVDITIGTTTIRTFVVGLADGGDLLDLPVPAPGTALLARGLPEAPDLVRLLGPLSEIELTPAGSVDYPLGRPVLLSQADARRLLQPPAALTEVVRTLFGAALPGLDADVTAALLTVEPERLEAVRSDLASRPEVARVDDRGVEREDLQRVFRLTRAFILVIAGFAVVLGLALLVNTVLVNAAERRRELATLRVLGVGSGEVGRLFVLEVLAVTLVGLVPGVPLAWWVAGLAMADFPDFIPAGIGLYPDVVALVVVAAVLTMLLASWPAVRDLARCDLAAVVRERE
jgi:putative ABC transport system permease protein